MIYRMTMLGLIAVAASSCSVFERHESRHTAARSVPDLSVDRSNDARGQRRIYASLRDDVAADYTGCVDKSDSCYVLGEAVDSRLRFEPQTGRFWFLDPGSGNTYFADGELRTGDPLRARPVLLPREGVYPEGDISLSVPGEGDTEDYLGENEGAESAEGDGHSDDR